MEIRRDTLESLTDDQLSWLDNALYELKGLRGWSWDQREWDTYREITGDETGEDGW